MCIILGLVMMDGWGINSLTSQNAVELRSVCFVCKVWILRAFLWLNLLDTQTAVVSVNLGLFCCFN